MSIKLFKIKLNKRSKLTDCLLSSRRVKDSLVILRREQLTFPVLDSTSKESSCNEVESSCDEDIMLSFDGKIDSLICSFGC